MIKTHVERLLFASRFLLTPLYLALAVSLLALLGKAGLHLYELLTQFSTLDDEGVLLTELAIVDMTLTASLVVIVFLSGYTNFVAPVVMRKDDGRPHWIAEIDFGELKLKLMASIVAISAIKLLEGFMDVAHRQRPRTRLARRHPSGLRRLDAVSGARRSPQRPSPRQARRRRLRHLDRTFEAASRRLRNLLSEERRRRVTKDEGFRSARC